MGQSLRHRLARFLPGRRGKYTVNAEYDLPIASNELSQKIRRTSLTRKIRRKSASVGTRRASAGGRKTRRQRRRKY